MWVWLYIYMSRKSMKFFQEDILMPMHTQSALDIIFNN